MLGSYALPLPEGGSKISHWLVKDGTCNMDELSHTPNSGPPRGVATASPWISPVEKKILNVICKIFPNICWTFWLFHCKFFRKIQQNLSTIFAVISGKNRCFRSAYTLPPRHIFVAAAVCSLATSALTDSISATNFTEGEPVTTFPCPREMLLRY